MRSVLMDQSPHPCDARTVSKEGRIVCSRIVEGENGVSPEVCYACPVKSVNCRNLRFSLRQITPRPLIVRYNGRTEVWDDEPPALRFEQAACTARVVPIEDPRRCAGCGLRQPLVERVEQPVRRRRRAVAGGKVVPFRGREVMAATG